MKKKILLNLLLFCSFISANSQSKTIDTLIDVGNHKLHFKIVPGKGTPILFDAGGGNDGSVWKSILEKISSITNAPLITYDRAGFGLSTIDTLQTDESKHGIISSIEDLEIGLKKLGYDKEILLVSHSYGGYLSKLYASRHPKLVKGIVLIDVNHNYFEDGYIQRVVATQDKLIPEWKKNKRGTYYMAATIFETVKIMSSITIPQNIPVIDFVNGNSFLKTVEETERWKECHRKFVAENPNVTGITANDCGHAIWIDNPALVINSISKLYSNTSKQKAEILERALQYSISACNEEKAQILAYNNSEEDLNNWGYQLLGKNEDQKATEVFRLNTLINPTSSNVYDSYGEALLKTNQKEEAIKMYKKSVELNPENQNGKDILKKMKTMTKNL